MNPEINVERYLQLAEIQKVTVLTYDEQEEMIAISTQFLNELLKKDEALEIMKRLRNR
jgi:hypothetical protein